MPLPTKNTAPPRELAPAGTYSAICVGHYHLGTQETPFGDHEQIVLSFAIDEKKSDGKPFILSTNPLKLSFDERSNLAGYLKSWIGRTIPQGEEFDTASLLDKPCLLTISQGVSKKGNTYVSIDTISSLPKRTQPFEYDGDTDRDYSPIDPTNPIPEWVPQWIAGLIQQSKEWKAYHQNGAAATTNGHGPAQSNGNGPSYSAPPEKPPVAVKPYLKMLGLSWPYKIHDLEEALERGAQNPNNSPEDIAEIREILEPHADSVPF